MDINITKYQPTEKRLNDFRIWHVEPLLNQAADLLDKCKDELREFNLLAYNAKQQEFELSTIEQDIRSEKERLEVNERDLIIANKKDQFYKSTADEIERAVGDAHALYDFGVNENQGKAGWTKAEQNKMETAIMSQERTVTNEINIKQIDWATSDKKVAEQRLVFRENLLQIKKELSQNGEVLDFNWQKQLVHKQLERDYTDALDRIFVANRGLKIIYGYEINYEEEFKNLKKQNESEVISKASIWVRNAIEWLVAYGQLDQSFTRVISIFSLLQDDEKKKLLSSGNNCILNLKIPNNLFDGHDNVRLRGIGASMLGNVGIIPWTIEVGVPTKVIYKRNGQKNGITQTLPTCLLGRVQNSYYTRNLEICGLISLMNASPYAQEDAIGIEGMWTINIRKPLNSPENFGELKDILIELNLTGKLL